MLSCCQSFWAGLQALIILIVSYLQHPTLLILLFWFLTLLPCDFPPSLSYSKSSPLSLDVFLYPSPLSTFLLCSWSEEQGFLSDMSDLEERGWVTLGFHFSATITLLALTLLFFSKHNNHQKCCKVSLTLAALAVPSMGHNWVACGLKAL